MAHKRHLSLCASFYTPRLGRWAGGAASGAERHRYMSTATRVGTRTDSTRWEGYFTPQYTETSYSIQSPTATPNHQPIQGGKVAIQLADKLQTSCSLNHRQWCQCLIKVYTIVDCLDKVPSTIACLHKFLFEVNFLVSMAEKLGCKSFAHSFSDQAPGPKLTASQNFSSLTQVIRIHTPKPEPFSFLCHCVFRSEGTSDTSHSMIKTHSLVTSLCCVKDEAKLHKNTKSRQGKQLIHKMHQWLHC